MKITVFNQQRKLSILTSSLKRMVLFVLKTYEANCEEVNVHLVSKNTITKLHGDFFQDPTPTDCITFPFAEDSLLGEIFICPEVAIEYANKNKKDPHQETSLYIVHALLHLLGFDDIEKKDRLEMRKQESKTLKLLRKNDLFLKPKKRIVQNPF